MALLSLAACDSKFVVPEDGPVPAAAIKEVMAEMHAESAQLAKSSLWPNGQKDSIHFYQDSIC